MVSIIIPCYNYGHLIADTINSVLNQTYSELEVIVINDGSKDNTGAVVDTIAAKDARVKCYSFENTGLGASRNRGLEKAKGEYIQFLDADDLLEPKKLEEQIKLFSTNPQADVIYGSVRYFTNEPFNEADRRRTYWGADKEWMPKYSGPGKQILADCLKGNFAHLSSPLFIRQIVDKTGLFDNSISAVADHHFILRTVINNASWLYHDTPGTYSLVRWHPDNMSKNANFMRSEEIKMREMLKPLLIDNAEASLANNRSIEWLQIQVTGSWKKIFLSGGPFDPIKRVLSKIGIAGLLRKIVYKK